jgi:hypothetical protein
LVANERELYVAREQFQVAQAYESDVECFPAFFGGRIRLEQFEKSLSLLHARKRNAAKPYRRFQVFILGGWFLAHGWFVSRLHVEPNPLTVTAN